MIQPRRGWFIDRHHEGSMSLPAIHRLGVTGVLAAAITAAALGPAYDNIRQINGAPIVWRSMPIQYVLAANRGLFSYAEEAGYYGGFPGPDYAEMSLQEAYAVLRQCFQSFQDLDTSRVTFREDPLFSPSNDATIGDDGRNTVTFSSSILFQGVALPPGVVGINLATYEDEEAPTGAVSYIVDSDIIFNDIDYRFVANEPANQIIVGPGLVLTVNLRQLATHEIGHLLGMAHSFVRSPINTQVMLLPRGYEIPSVPYLGMGAIEDSALMFPFIGFSSASNGFITPDDAASVASYYPEPVFRSRYGVVTGRVADVFTGSPIFGAQVVLLKVSDAVNDVTGALNNAVIGKYTETDGRYIIEGVPPGQYLALAEPVEVGRVNYYLTNPELKLARAFPTAFHPSARSPHLARVFTVEAGRTTADIDIGVLDALSRYDEGEPNDRPTVARELAPDSVPVFGQLDRALDQDVFRFFAQRGDLVRIEILAKRYGSQLDPYLRLYDAVSLRAPGVADSADAFNIVPPLERAYRTPGVAPDAKIEFRVPKTGTYFVVVTDAQGRAGADYWYALDYRVLSRLVSLAPLSEPTALVGFDISVEKALGSQFAAVLQLKSVTVRLESDDPGGMSYNPDNPGVRDMFLSPTRDAESGVALYDNSGPGRDRFDLPGDATPLGDRIIRLAKAPTVIQRGANRIEIVFEPETPVNIPQRSDGGIIDFWVVARSSLDLLHGDNFRATIPPGGIVVENLSAGGELALFNEPIPVYPNTFYGDIVRLVNLTDEGQTIDAMSPQTAVIGLNVLGAPSQDYFIKEVSFTIVGFNGKALTTKPFSHFLSPLLALYPEAFEVPPENEVPADRPHPLRENLSPDDFTPLLINGTGGFGVYWDSTDANGRDGQFDPRLDVALPLRAFDAAAGTLGIRFEEIPRYEIPEQFIRSLLPDFAQALFPARLVDQLPITAFKVVLPLRDTPELQGLLRVPSTDSVFHRTKGSDYFLVVRTSSAIRALDTFLPMVFAGDVVIQSGLSLAREQRPDPVVSAVSLDAYSSYAPSAVVCRPVPQFQITDISRVRGAEAVLATRAEGAPPLPVIGINANDRGQNMFNFFENTISFRSVDAMRYFNASPVLDAFTMRLVPDDDTRNLPQDMLELITPTIRIDANSLENLPSNGVWFVLDDDTGVGDNLDNDGDGRFDEERYNLQDDDLDGRIDEDLGSVDPSSGQAGNGVFDRWDSFFPQLYNQSNNPNLYQPVFPGVALYIPPNSPLIQPAQPDYDLDPTAPAPPTASQLIYRMPLEGQVTTETGPDYSFFEVGPFPFTPHQAPQPQTVVPLDLHSFFYPIGAFLRFDRQPVFYYNVIPTVSLPGWAFSNAPGTAWQHGVMVENDTNTTPFPSIAAEVSYNYKLEIPDDDRGPLAGDDFFIALRAGRGARLGDKFRVIFDSIEHSVYQDTQGQAGGVNTAQPIAFPRSATFSLVTAQIRVGRGTAPPTISILAPALELGENRVNIANQFTVILDPKDPDSDAWISIYLDDDPHGRNGALVKENLLENDRPLSYTLDFNFLIPELRLDSRRPYWVYVKIDDGVNEPVYVYSSAPILLRRDTRSSFGYLKLQDNGKIHVVHDYDRFSSGADNSLDRFRSYPTPSIVGKAQDIEATFGSDGALMLLANGTVYGFGNIFESFPSGPVWSSTNTITGYPLNVGTSESASRHFFMRPDDTAVDIAVDWKRGAYYILSRNTGLIWAYWATNPAGVPANQLPPLVNALRAWNTSGRAVTTFEDMELTPDGGGLYVLQGNGRVAAIGNASTRLVADINRLLSPVPPAIDLDMTPTGGGLVVMDTMGLFQAVGDAPQPRSDGERAQFAAFLTDNGRDTAKSIKVLRGDGGMEGYIGMSRSGRVTVTPSNLLALPIDGIITPNAMQDLEPSAISSLSTVSHAVVNLYEAMRTEDYNAIVAMTSRDYSDSHGNDYYQFLASLRLLFDSYEIRDYSIGPLLRGGGRAPSPDDPELVSSATDSLRSRIEVTFLGNRVIANVQTSFIYYLPRMHVLNLPRDADTLQTFGYPFEVDELDTSGIPYTQVNFIRELGDGREWKFDIYRIRETANLPIFTPADLDALEPQDLLFLRRRNDRIFSVAFDNAGRDGPWRVRFDSRGPAFNDLYLLVFSNFDTLARFGPPEMEFITFGTDAVMTSGAGQDVIEATHEFKYENGRLMLTGMDLFLTQTGPQEPAVGRGEEGLTTTESPLVFNMDKRGLIANRFIGSKNNRGDYGNFRIGEGISVDCIDGGIINLSALGWPVPITQFTLDPTPQDMRLTPTDRRVINDMINENVTRFMLRQSGQGAPPYSLELDEENLLPGDVIMVLDCDNERYFLITVYAVNTADELLSFHWHVFPEFILRSSVAVP